jgi:hypothetical protein
MSDLKNMTFADLRKFLLRAVRQELNRGIPAAGKHGGDRSGEQERGTFLNCTAGGYLARLKRDDPNLAQQSRTFASKSGASRRIR